MEDSFHYLLMINYTSFQKKLLERVKDSGMTSGQPRIMDYLKDHDGASQKEIAAGCNMEAGSLTSVLNRMEERGMVQRKMLNGNRRTFHVFLTQSGRELQQDVEQAFLEMEKRAFAGFSEEEREQFLELFLRINKNIREKE